MSDTKYLIYYNRSRMVTRTSARAMKIYLNKEERSWAHFLQKLAEQPNRVMFTVYQRSINGEILSRVFEQLKGKLENPNEFNRITSGGYERLNVPPPQSDAVEGRLIIGLNTAGRFDDALAAYVRFVSRELGEHVRMGGANDEMQKLHSRGEMLLTAAYAASALPQSDALISADESKAAIAERLAALDQAIKEAEKTNSDHDAGLRNIRDNAVIEANRLKQISIKSHRRRGRLYREWRNQVGQEVERRFIDAEQRISRMNKDVARRQLAHETAFQELQSLFYTQLRLRAPVALWEQRAKDHRKNAALAHRNFWFAAIAAVLAGVGVPLFVGDYIAGSFSVLACLPDQPQNCVRQFSAKGPLTVAGVILTISLILWITRLQYRVFLSERHLSLDADEKKAFAETFMALKQDASVDVSNETIVLASLFRPTQDGIIKDEDGGFDLSAAAVLSRHLAK